MIFFTADEHYYHKNIIKYANRPYDDVFEMNRDLINRFNSVVQGSDVTIHAGDFSFGNKTKTQEIIDNLNGCHIFLSGDHDRWMNKNMLKNRIYIYKKHSYNITVCHFCMRVWPKSHYNSWHLFGHSHGNLDPIGKSLDIGVDTNDYTPYSIIQIDDIMKTKPDNFNKLR